MSLRRALWLFLPLAAVILDLQSKIWITNNIPMHGSRTILPGLFNLTLSMNPGAIFGTLGSAPAWLRTTLFAVAGLVALGYFGWEFLKDGTPRLQRVGLGLILGGAIGNGLDRLLHGAVVDFLDVILFGWHYWTFNIADSFIVCGALLLLGCFLRDYLVQRKLGRSVQKLPIS